MFRYDRVEIIEAFTYLERSVWSFWFDDRDTLQLDYYKFQSRKSKRHGWKDQTCWNRYNGRENNIERPSIPLWIQQRAKSDFLSQFSAGLKVEE